MRTWDYGEAVVVRQLLATYGIHCLVDSDVPHTVMPISIARLGELRLWVSAHRRSEARALLADHRRQGLRVLNGGKCDRRRRKSRAGRRRGG